MESCPLQQAVFNDYGYKLLSTNSAVTIKHMKEFDRFNKENLAVYNDFAYKILDVENPVDVGLYEEKTFKILDVENPVDVGLYEEKTFKILDVENPVDVGLYEEKTFKNRKNRQVKVNALLKQRLIITFSRKMMEYQHYIRNAQIARARHILEHKNVEDVKKGPHDVTRFINRKSVGKNGEKAIDYYEINQSVIDEEEKYDGYYAVATNLEDDAKAILEINSRRYKIEDCFRILKTNFRARPVHHRNKNRIIAHFMICYTALLIYRLLECKLDQYGTHFTTENILETLRNMNVMNVQDLYYAAAYKGSQVCTALNGVYALGLDKKYYIPKELNKKIKKIL